MHQRAKRTRRRILKASLQLFNERGFINVRLQHIADACGISVGNLAYHYPHKEAIVFALVDELFGELALVMANYNAVPLFEHIDNVLRQLYALEQRYAFYFLDTLEIYRHYPKLARYAEEKNRLQIVQLKGMFLFNAARGAFQKDVDYGGVAENFWMVSHLWMYAQKLLGVEEMSLEAFMRRMWGILMPHFTPMGRWEYEQLVQRADREVDVQSAE